MYKAIFPPLKMVLLNLSSIFSVCISISNCNMGAATTSGKTSTLAAATAAATSNCRLQINLSCLPLDNLCILSQDRTHTHAGCRTRHLQNLLLLLLLLSLMFHYIFFCGLREGYSSMHMEAGKSNASNDEEEDGSICAERFYTEKNIKMYKN